MSSSCDCCEDGCPHGNWVTLDRWRGSKTIPNNLRDLQLNDESIWGILELDKYKDSNWQWRVVVLGTGNIPDLTKLCLQQNRRQIREWISPLSEQLSTVFFKLELGNVRWEDALLAVHSDLIGGDFTLTLKAFSWSETTTVLPWDATAQEVQDALQALPNAARAGTIEVTGVPLAFDEHMTVACIAPLDFISITATTNFIGTSPPVSIYTETEGGVPLPTGGVSDEVQIASYDWPADGGTWTLSVTAEGNTQTTKPMSHVATENVVKILLTDLINLDTPPSGDIHSVTREMLDTHVRRYYVTFGGSKTNTNMQQMTATSSLTNIPTLIITTPTHSNVYAFRNEYQPLNVGTIWHGFLRKGYGNEDARKLRGYVSSILQNPGETPGTVNSTELPCGYSVQADLGNCVIHRPFDTTLPYDPFELISKKFPYVAHKDSAINDSNVIAHFKADDGTVVVTSTLPFEFAFQIRCVECYHDMEFNLWGSGENTTLRDITIYDPRYPHFYEPPGPYTCPRFFDGLVEAVSCVDWVESYSPQVHRTAFRGKVGPDGYDAHLINDKFFADGAFKARKPPCQPDVVLLGDGFFLSQHYSRSFQDYGCTVPNEFFTPYALEAGCCAKPLRESTTEHQVTAIERLKAIYGKKFSHWGGWIDPESLTLPEIRCTFDNYDLTDIKVLFLGGLSIGICPQTRTYYPPGQPYPPIPGQITGGNSLQLQFGDDFFSTGASWKNTVEKDFEALALEPLKKWLDLGGKVLVLDGGVFPVKFFEALGLSSTVSSSVLNGSLIDNTAVWGPLASSLNPPQFEPLYVDPEPHPFTKDVPKGKNVDGSPLLVFDSTMAMRDIAGFASDKLPISVGFLTSIPIKPTSRRNRGLLNISQKYDYDEFFNSTSQAYDHEKFNYDKMTAGIIYVPPAPGVPAVVYQTSLIQEPSYHLRSYTTSVLQITPSPGSIVIGTVKGKLIDANLWNNDPRVVSTTDIDYPCVVVEHWGSGFSSGSSFQLSFTHSGTTEITGILPFNADASTIKSALEALPNILTGLDVVGGPLPGSVDITFNTLSTTLQNVAQLKILNSVSIKVETVTKGSITENEVQRLSLVLGPSRIVISQVSELVEPDTWGQNWGGLPILPVIPLLEDGSSEDGVSDVRYTQDATYPIVSIIRAFPIEIPEDYKRVPFPEIFRGCTDLVHIICPVQSYNCDGYNFGLGLSNIASAKFLLNLLENRNEY